MKFIIIISLFLFCIIGCSDIEDYSTENDCFNVGSMRCHENLSQMCNAHDYWETYRDCTAINKRCSIDAADNSGYTDMASCVD
jgi:hypothetical protein